MTKNKNCWIGLRKWLKCVSLMKLLVRWFGGRNERLIKLMVDSGLATPLNPEKRPGCYLFRSDPSDVARVEDRTFIASKPKKMQDLQTTG